MSTNKLKVSPTSFYKAGPKEALLIYQTLNEAYEDSKYSMSSSRKKMLRRLRDLAAVAVGKPTIEQLEEEDY